jgi:hypothetical protein
MDQKAPRPWINNVSLKLSLYGGALEASGPDGSSVRQETAPFNTKSA